MREKQHQRGLSASYLEPDRYDEEEEGEESISLAAIKNRYKGGIRGECGIESCHLVCRVCHLAHELTAGIKSQCLEDTEHFLPCVRDEVSVYLFEAVLEG